MNLRRTCEVMLKDLRQGPRSSVFLFALVMPLVFSFLLQVVFMTILDPQPRLGVVDTGDSALTRAVLDLEGVDVRRLADTDQLWRMVEAHDLDAGLALPAGFDRAVQDGDRPDLEWRLSGECRAHHRLLLSVAVLDRVRDLTGGEAPITIETHLSGEPRIPLKDRLVPVLLIYALIVAGVFVTAFMIVEEREKGTLSAILVTPLTMGEALAGKGLLGLLMALCMAYLTLLLNGVSVNLVVALLPPILTGSLMCVCIGLIFGSLARDASALYTLIKLTNVLIFAPVLFYIFPGWPGWIAKIFPTYWFIHPVYEIAVGGVSAEQAWMRLPIAAGFCLLLMALVVLAGRRLERKLAAG